MANKSNNKGNNKGIVKPLEIITKSLDKKDRITGKNKHEVKTLKAMCVHHKFNKKGKIVSKIVTSADGTCSCHLCKDTFPGVLYSQGEYEKTVKKLLTMNSQAKYLAVAVNAGAEAVSYFAQTGVVLSQWNKSYKNLTHVVEKHGSQKKNKKKNNGKGGSSEYGSWGK